MYKRKTKDEYEIQGHYGHGWETECTEDTWKEAKERLKEYRANSQYAVRCVKKRIRLTEVQPGIYVRL